jgi:hypothetical protein
MFFWELFEIWHASRPRAATTLIIFQNTTDTGKKSDTATHRNHCILFEALQSHNGAIGVVKASEAASTRTVLNQRTLHKSACF